MALVTRPHRRGGRRSPSCSMARTTYAVDGVVLIDEAAVLADGITPADAPGYPVTISEPGAIASSRTSRFPPA